MTDTHRAAVAAVRKQLAGRRLIWFGIRGEDGESLLALPELAASFSIIAKLRSPALDDRSNVSLEALTGVREDLDAYDIDDPASRTAAVTEFRRRLLNEVSGPCVLVAYRPSALVSALSFAKRDTMTLAALHKDRQQLFEHKPWVETELDDIGVRGLGWTYVADEHRHLAHRLLHRGPHVVRASRSSGGVGIARARTSEELDDGWPTQQDAFVGLAPYLDPTIPVNFSGCVFPDGTVRLHPPSIQVIGLPSCTDRPFGYVGNDFGAFKLLPAEIHQELQEMGTTIGRWLHSERYWGVFGVDALVHNGAVHFTEINPRFQGSSVLSARVARQMGLPDLFLDHLSAGLGLSAQGPDLTLADWAREQPDASRLVVHNVAPQPVTRDPRRPLPGIDEGVRIDQLAAPEVHVRSGAVLGALTLSRSVTTDGFSIDEGAQALTTQMSAAFAAPSAEDLV